MAKSAFKLHLEPQVFLNNVYSANGLSKLVADATAIVAFKDIQKLQRTEKGAVSVNPMEKQHVESIIKSIRDIKGREVYAKSRIDFREISPNSNVMSSQTFVEVEKVANMIKLFNALRDVGFTYAGGSAHFVSYEKKGEKYIAFYLPPIAERVPKESIKVPLMRLQERAKRQEKIILPAWDGDGAINLREVIKDTKQKIIWNEDLTTLPILRDGAHRVNLAHIHNLELPIVLIEGGEAPAKSVPIKFDKVITTRNKPFKKEDRFLGFEKEAWLDFESVGIDG